MIDQPGFFYWRSEQKQLCRPGLPCMLNWFPLGIVLTPDRFRGSAVSTIPSNMCPAVRGLTVVLYPLGWCECLLGLASGRNREIGLRDLFTITSPCPAHALASILGGCCRERCAGKNCRLGGCQRKRVWVVKNKPVTNARNQGSQLLRCQVT